MRLLSKSTSSAWCRSKDGVFRDHENLRFSDDDECCRAGWSRRPSRTQRAFGCKFQPTHFGKVEGDYIRLRRHGPVWDVRSKR